MNKVYIRFISTLVFSLLAFNSVGQEIMVKGFVTTFDSIPLNQVEIIVSSSKLKVFSDSIGEFEFKCLAKDKIKASANGFSSKKIKIEEGNKNLHVNLELKSGFKNREIAVGYGHVKDDKRLTAISNMNNDDEDFSQFTDIYALLGRMLVGVRIVNKEIIIRGPNSVNGNNAALVVVDGVPTNSRALENLSPVNVKSVSLLKGIAASVYGSRGAGGVVVIKTKTGED